MFNFPPWRQHTQLKVHRVVQKNPKTNKKKPCLTLRFAFDYKLHFLIFCSVAFKDGTMWVALSHAEFALIRITLVTPACVMIHMHHRNITKSLQGKTRSAGCQHCQQSEPLWLHGTHVMYSGCCSITPTWGNLQPFFTVFSSHGAPISKIIAHVSYIGDLFLFYFFLKTSYSQWEAPSIPLLSESLPNWKNWHQKKRLVGWELQNPDP